MHEHVDDLVQYDVIFNLYTEKKLIYGNMLCHNKFNFIIIKTSFVFFFYPYLTFTPRNICIARTKGGWTYNILEVIVYWSIKSHWFWILRYHSKE